LRKGEWSRTPSSSVGQQCAKDNSKFDKENPDEENVDQIREIRERKCQGDIYTIK